MAASQELFAVATSGGDFGAVGSSEQVVSTTADGAQSVYAGDVDGDGDLDLMSASGSDNKIAWYENDGSQTFTKRVVSTKADRAISVYAADVDGDGDLDLMSASRNDDTIAWYRNDGVFGISEHLVTTNADGARSVYAGDVDGDGDLDLLSTSYYDDKIAWYENTVPVSVAGRALSFDGTGDYVAIPEDNALDLTNGFTLEAWVQPAGIDGTFQQIIAKDGAYSFGFNSSLLQFSTIGVQDYDLSFALSAGEWSHIGVVFDTNNDATFYVNGANVGTLTGSAPATTSTNPLSIGQSGSDSEFFNGVMDEVRIWNTQRSPQDIRQDIYQALSGAETGLVGYYRFNEENGSPVGRRLSFGQ